MSKDKKKVQKMVPVSKKVEPVYKTFLYLMPQETSARALMEKLDFVAPDALEIWPEIDILEVTLENERTITFENLREDLYEEDYGILEEMGFKDVYLFEYAEEDRVMMQKVMGIYLEAFGGKIASDTDDFMPMLDVAEL
ncbi:MAG: hypothetical protein KBT01_01850 [Clostridiales bacterium]|nr:hypothetical protein [Candidatus Blautia equi]